MTPSAITSTKSRSKVKKGLEVYPTMGCDHNRIIAPSLSYLESAGLAGWAIVGLAAAGRAVLQATLGPLLVGLVRRATESDLDTHMNRTPHTTHQQCFVKISPYDAARIIKPLSHEGRPTTYCELCLLSFDSKDMVNGMKIRITNQLE